VISRACISKTRCKRSLAISKRNGKLFQMNEDAIIIHADGGARGNPGPAACAFVAEMKGKIIRQESKFLDASTNNYAEYQGVLLALKWLCDNYESLSVGSAIFYLDSELVVRQLNGAYKVKDKKLIELFHQVNKLSENLSFAVSYKNIPRSKNRVADFLVNKELDKRCGV
jgi:ribonuclease HI